ncbi:DUF3299 domain-containing protein [Colwellia echini]|uniref:DUF3299 domain-containing protein n=2 Tax=Colwellia echini TaxID=1982103 RepID=A0ABY3MXA8_9GAMM|nr:DUF3299 domain-containing protein [Colwellia echini]
MATKSVDVTPSTKVSGEKTPSATVSSNDTSAENIQPALVPTDFISADWVDLMPKDDLEALLNPPSYLDEIADGSTEDELADKFNNTNDAKNNNETSTEASDESYQQALSSTRVITALNNVPIRLPAFIVPLEFDEEQKVTQFFMVPYFGACIHLPPPPPNQTIFVNYPKGIKLNSISDPYWFSGILKTSLIENEMATAAYTLDVHAFEPYTEAAGYDDDSY